MIMTHMICGLLYEVVGTQRPKDRDMAVAYFLSNGHKRERDRCPKRQPSGPFFLDFLQFFPMSRFS
jgi:hypothetical protein